MRRKITTAIVAASIGLVAATPASARGGWGWGAAGLGLGLLLGGLASRPYYPPPAYYPPAYYPPPAHYYPPPQSHYAPPPPVYKDPAMPSGQIVEREIPIKRFSQHGSPIVSVNINDKITLDFIVDSGATDTVVPSDIFDRLLETGVFSQSDLGGFSKVKTADGVVSNLRELNIGKLTAGTTFVSNVSGIIGEGHEPLLGQSFLSRFKSYAIDNERMVLVLKYMPASQTLNAQTSTTTDHGLSQTASARVIPASIRTASTARLTCAVVGEVPQPVSYDPDPVYKTNITLATNNGNFQSFAVTHTARSGATYDRSLQYGGVSIWKAADKMEWFWKGHRGARATMIGEVYWNTRDGWMYQETIFDGDREQTQITYDCHE